jgi:hypothetical protein
VQHFLSGDSEEHPTPALDRPQLIVAKTGTCCALEAERGVQVFAHHSMLKLGSLAEKIGQLLAALHHNCRLSAHERKLSPGESRAQ